MALQLRTRHRLLHNPSLVHFYSSNTPDPTTPPPPQPDSTTSDSPASQSPFTSSYISDVKARLKQQEQNQQLRQQFTRRPTYASSFADRPQNPPPKFSSLEEIRKNLSEFRRRSAGPIPGEQSHSSAPPVRFQELYKRNVLPRGGDEPYGYGPGPARPMGDLSLGAVRESLKHLQPNARDRTEKRGDGEPLAFSKFKESLKLKPAADNSGYGQKVSAGTEALPFSVFGKEFKEREAAKGKEGEGPTDEALSSAMLTEFVKMYSYKELGERLRTLRPETDKKGGGGFSLEELNERLRRLRELEESETQSKLGGIIFKELRESLTKVKISDEEKSKKRSLERLDIIGQMTQTPEFMMNPPKEHLVEKYFHPDNMSSAEKLKIELAKVRDEFKLSESDCGSARVQVAQLTTKIMHLASVLHKKDKHSRKGLEAMVQKRKKLLKYLRRTDWESYCLVLSKLGLRDNADIKH